MLTDEATERELRALYDETEALLEGNSCALSGDCCHFANEGEPYPTPAELALVFEALRKKGITLAPAKRVRGGKHLPVVAGDRRCPILGHDGRCRIYEDRPFGCRTFFCERRTGPGKLPRKEIVDLGRRIAAVSARAFPRDPQPRPLVRALEEGAARLHRGR
ncbi:hypothetical protein BH09MYX1_BH09MYX1_20860 [soil metagenome]